MSNVKFLNITEQKHTLSSIQSAANSKYNNVCHTYYHLFNEYLPYITSFNVHTHSVAPTEAIFEHQREVTFLTSQRELMPLAVRYIDKSGNYYVERPPFKININYKNCRAFDSTRETVDDLQMWIPWSIMSIQGSFSYSFNPSDVKIVFSHKPLEKNTDIYVNPFLPNSYTDGRICWSNSFNSVSSLNTDKNEIKSFDLTYWHSLILNDYMMGGWNTDLVCRPLQFMDIISHHISDTADENYFPITKQYFSSNYDILDKYVNMSDYPDIVQQIYYICLNKFRMTPKRSKIISHAQTTKQKDGDSFVRFFAFMSLLSLEDTLTFYKQAAQAAIKIHSVSRNWVSSHSSFVYQKFSAFSKDSELVEDSTRLDTDNFLPVSLPINKYLTSQKAMDNGDYLASSRAGKNVYVNCYIENLSSSQQEALRNGYHFGIMDLLNELKISSSTFVSLLNDVSNSTESKVYIRIDAKTKSIYPYSLVEFKQLLSSVSQQISASIEKHREKNSKKKKNSNRSHYDEIRIDTISSLQKQEYAYDLFKI